LSVATVPLALVFRSVERSFPGSVSEKTRGLDAMAHHVRQHPAALLATLSQPESVRSAVLLGGPRQIRSACPLGQPAAR
jgi:hypothetical protein